MTLFGMLFSILMTQSSRPARSWNIDMAVPCVFEDGFRCAPPKRK
jgi:hypothetical protein